VWHFFHIVVMTLAYIGGIAWIAGTAGIFICWAKFCFIVTGHLAPNGRLGKETVFFLKVFGFANLYIVFIIVVIHVMGPP
jgi:hypothetical protein